VNSTGNIIFWYTYIVIQVVILKKWTGYIAHDRNAYKHLAEKPGGKRSFGKPWHCW
jgi:hypothetical protein